LFGYSGAVQSIAKTGTLFFKYYTDAELKKLEASGFINGEGEAEYVLGIEPDLVEGSAQDFITSIDGVKEVRTTSFDNWFVVTVNSNTKENIRRLRELSQIRFVLQNRGVWLCH
jgi:hypothetical protein